mmetsp:Transcript_14273/g.22248  ORF Transcript_14273/g.22248 Transcript_14273/m.22248 type:complete len:226 (+) Transcript_14273:997-1674(+)
MGEQGRAVEERDREERGFLWGEREKDRKKGDRGEEIGESGERIDDEEELEPPERPWKFKGERGDFGGERGDRGDRGGDRTPPDFGKRVLGRLKNWKKEVFLSDLRTGILDGFLSILVPWRVSESSGGTKCCSFTNEGKIDFEARALSILNQRDVIKTLVTVPLRRGSGQRSSAKIETTSSEISSGTFKTRSSPESKLSLEKGRDPVHIANNNTPTAQLSHPKSIL